MTNIKNDMIKPKGVRIAECVMPSNDEEKQKLSCQTCNISGHCITVNPDLAELLEKCKNENGKYGFSKKDVDFLDTNYPEVLVYSEEPEYIEYILR